MICRTIKIIVILLGLLEGKNGAQNLADCLVVCHCLNWEAVLWIYIILYFLGLGLGLELEHPEGAESRAAAVQQRVAEAVQASH